MEKKNKVKSPVIISGSGGSGTRVLAEIFKELNFYIGFDLNKAYDNLTFTYIFKLPAKYYNSFNDKNKKLNRLIKLHEKILHYKKISFIDYFLLINCGLSHIFNFKHYNYKWVLKRMKEIIKMKNEKKFKKWAWKEPHNVFFLESINHYYPNAKFILLTRNGLDMVYSKTDQQFRNYAFYLGLDHNDFSPKNLFEFWYRFNKYAIEIGNKLFKNKFIIIRFEDLCINKEKTLKKLLGFILDKEINEIPYDIYSIPQKPKSINRYQVYYKNWIDNDVIKKLNEIGYNI